MDLLDFSGLNNDLSLVAFSSMVAWAEGTFPHPITVAKGYDVIVNGLGGKPEIFSDFSKHPFTDRKAKQVTKNGLHSTASGRYQILYRWWKPYSGKLQLDSFNNINQDKYFVQILKEQKALELIAAGDIQGAIKRVSNIWASMPGAGYGQQERKVDGLLSVYDKAHEEAILKEFRAEDTDVALPVGDAGLKRLSDLVEVFHANYTAAIEIGKNKG